jgi:hypothetical protein
MNDIKKMIEKEINEYTNKYAAKHKISIEEAQKHIMVKLTNEYYRGHKND